MREPLSFKKRKGSNRRKESDMNVEEELNKLGLGVVFIYNFFN